jgi:hypothetical protein
MSHCLKYLLIVLNLMTGIIEKKSKTKKNYWLIDCYLYLNSNKKWCKTWYFSESVDIKRAVASTLSPDVWFRFGSTTLSFFTIKMV